MIVGSKICTLTLAANSITIGANDGYYKVSVYNLSTSTTNGTIIGGAQVDGNPSSALTLIPGEQAITIATTEQELSGNAIMNFYISYAKGHNQAAFSTEKDVSLAYNTVNIATTPRYQHRIDEVQFTTPGGSATLLDTSLLEVDGVILVNFDFATIPTISGGSSNNPFVHFIDIHYQSTGVGTKQKVPNFYT
jgi:hypothetical protein